MSVLKVACPKCGQKVSGDETFYGRKVNCPICTSKIEFPEGPALSSTASSFTPTPPAGGGSAPQEPAFDTLVPGYGAPGPVPPAGSDSPPSSSSQGPQPPSMDEAPPQAGLSVDKNLHKDDPVYPDPPQREHDYPDPPQREHDPHDSPAPKKETRSEDFGSTSQAAAPFSGDDDDSPSAMPGTLTLVCGVLACLGGGLVFAPIAIIVGHILSGKSKDNPDARPTANQRRAKIGMILGYVSVALTILFLLVILLTKSKWAPWLSSLLQGGA